MRSPGLRNALFCFVSGVLCGLLNAARCPNSLDGACPIAALQVFYGPEIGWAVWLDWINWVPGLVFGTLLSLAAVDWRQVDQRSRAAQFLIAAAIIYVLAGPLFFGTLLLTENLVSGEILWLLPAGFITGAFGALGLAVAARMLFPLPGHPKRALGWTALTAALGGVAGLAFVTVCFFGAAAIVAAWPLAFVLWQVPVGLALRRAAT